MHELNHTAITPKPTGVRHVCTTVVFIHIYITLNRLGGGKM